MKILTLSTYPIKNPMHGGQLRVRNIVDTYRSAGHSVEVVGVLGSEHYDSEEGFLPFPSISQLSSVIHNSSLMEDYAIGQLYVTDDKCYQLLAGSIQDSPDVIHVENPWLFAFAMRYRDERALSAILVYGSQNIECFLKEEILLSYQGKVSSQLGAALIEKVELHAIKNADAIVCVSENDLAWISSLTDKPVVLAPNGVKPWKSTESGRQEATLITKGCAYALYVASAHPPNITGFFDIFGGGFGSLKPDEKLVIAGGAGWSIAGDVRVRQSAKLAEKVVFAGLVSQFCLEGLLDDAHCIVLPLTQGGGTNLKTAEALWSGKYVIATTVAMRGFERFIGSRGVFLADDSSTFKRALRHVMSLTPLKLSLKEVEARRAVLWEANLEQLPGFLESLSTEVLA